jgi:hypothetical protein
MSPSEQLVILVNLRASERKQLEKALTVLQKCGMDIFTAMDILLTAIKGKQVEARERLDAHKANQAPWNK